MYANKLKKAVSLLLVLVMVVCMLPSIASEGAVRRVSGRYAG